MTTDRKKAILFLSLTLLLGILIGSLIPAFYGRFRHREAREMRFSDGRENSSKDNRAGMSRQDRFSHMIMRVVKPDSDQAKQIKPLMEATALKIEALEKGSNERMEIGRAHV